MAWVEFFSVFLLRLATGVSFSHLLQRGPKQMLPAAQFLAVQQVLLRNYGLAIGGLEGATFVSALAMAILTWGKPLVPMLADSGLRLCFVDGDDLGGMDQPDQ